MRIITQDGIMSAIENKIKNGGGYIDSILEYCNDHGLDVESVAEVIKKSQILKERVRSEGIGLLLVKE